MFISTDKTCHKFSLVNLINFARYGCIQLLAHVTVPNRQCLACSNRKTQMAIVGYLCHIKVEKLILIHIFGFFVAQYSLPHLMSVSSSLS